MKTIIIHDWTSVRQREYLVGKFNNIAKELMIHVLTLNLLELARLERNGCQLLDESS